SHRKLANSTAGMYSGATRKIENPKLKARRLGGVPFSGGEPHEISISFRLWFIVFWGDRMGTGDGPNCRRRSRRERRRDSRRGDQSDPNGDWSGSRGDL